MEPSNAATKPPEGFSPNSGTASDNWVKLQRLGSGDLLGGSCISTIMAVDCVNSGLRLQLRLPRETLLP
jgi:hypothetical protein